MTKQRVGRWAAALLATGVLCVMAAGCGGDDDDEAGGAATTAAETTGGTPEGMLESLGEGEGQVNLIAWAGYVEDGTTDPKVDWVTDFEEETGCQVNVKTGNTSDEMVTLMRTGQYDGVSASGDEPALDRCGRRRPVNLRSDRELRERVRGAEEPAAQHRRRRPLRRAARPRGEPAPVPHGHRQAGARLLERRLGRELAVQGQGDRVRQPDLHRRRGRLPEGDAA